MADPNTSPTTTEFESLRSWLQGRGISQAYIDAVLGTAPGDRTRAEIAKYLRALLRAL